MCTLISKPINDVHYRENKQAGIFVKIYLPKASDDEYLPKFTSSKHSRHTVAYYNMLIASNAMLVYVLSEYLLYFIPYAWDSCQVFNRVICEFDLNHQIKITTKTNTIHRGNTQLFYLSQQIGR